jgi:hypothetical protein
MPPRHEVREHKVNEKYLDVKTIVFALGELGH